MLKIRRVSQFQQQLQSWQQRYDLTLIDHQRTAAQPFFRLTLVSQTEKVEALIKAQDWCVHCWPALSHYAWQALAADTLLALFMDEIKGKTFFDNQYQCASVGLAEEGVEPYRLGVKETHLGEVLIGAPIDGLKVIDSRNTLLENLSFQADWVLGYSDISCKLLQTIELHDVLSIQRLALHMSIAGRTFAQFQKQEEGVFMIEELINSEEATAESIGEDFCDAPVQPFDMANMSVKLTFVLGHSEIALTEIAQIQPGSIFSIGENKEREVKVYANKQLIAEGELIYIGESDELGLEITRLISLGDKRV